MEAMAEAIAARDGSLRASLDEKDAMMREIHHRVKNNLQVISSLLNLQERALSDPAARSAMADTRRRVAALALIYRALYQGSDLKQVDVRQFLADPDGAAGDGAPGQRTDRPHRTDFADELIIDPDKLPPFALFAVEAISNAQKHALARNGGLLRVRFVSDGDQAVLSIIDEGSGSAPDLKKSGVGRALMTAFARQLRGRVELKQPCNALGGLTATADLPHAGPWRSRDGGRSRTGQAQGEPGRGLAVASLRSSRRP